MDYVAVYIAIAVTLGLVPLHILALEK